MNTRTPLTRLPIIAALGASLALAACAGEAEDTAADTTEATDGVDGVVENDALSGEEIEEAVPGVEDATPEGDTPNTADVADQENLEVTDDADGYE